MITIGSRTKCAVPIRAHVRSAVALKALLAIGHFWLVQDYLYGDQTPIVRMHKQVIAQRVVKHLDWPHLFIPGSDLREAPSFGSVPSVLMEEIEGREMSEYVGSVG